MIGHWSLVIGQGWKAIYKPHPVQLIAIGGLSSK